MDERTWLEEVQLLYRQHKAKCERAAAQVDDNDFFSSFGHSPNSVAVLMKHLGGNLRSRWRDFPATDGEKRDRDREGEFTTEGETRESIRAEWEEGWGIALESLAGLEPADLECTTTVRGQPLSAMQALHQVANQISAVPIAVAVVSTALSRVRHKLVPNAMLLSDATFATVVRHRVRSAVVARRGLAAG